MSDFWSTPDSSGRRPLLASVSPAISGEIERFKKSAPIFMGWRFLTDLLAKTIWCHQNNFN
jgi:hypothetical protein